MSTCEFDESKRPARIGRAWTDEEVVKLLALVRKKKTIEEIASEHERTRAGIKSRLREIAADYWFNNELPIEKIKKFTGLSENEIKYSIQRRTSEQKTKEYAKMPNQLEAYTKSLSSEKSEIVELKNEIQLLKREIQDMKKDTTEILSLIHAIYEVETIEE